MSVYKEFYYALNELSTGAKQIWPDSADYGTPTKKGDRMWKAAQAAARYFDPQTDKREVINYHTGTTVKLNITVYNEWDGSMAKEVWSLEYVTVRGRQDMDGFFTMTRLSRKRTKNLDY